MNIGRVLKNDYIVLSVFGGNREVHSVTIYRALYYRHGIRVDHHCCTAIHINFPNADYVRIGRKGNDRRAIFIGISNDLTIYINWSPTVSANARVTNISDSSVTKLSLCP